jgi:hypothetical protein
MKKIIWYSPDVQKPLDRQKIVFKPITDSDKQNLTYEGIYIESEDMYFVGFEDASDHFYFSWGIAFWRTLDKEIIDPIK